MKRVQVINQFVLKIIAYVFMTIDHLGIFLSMHQYSFSDPAFVGELANTCRILGRIAFPLIIFMVVEGVLHTKNFWAYFLRLSIIATSIMLVQIIGGYLVDSSLQTMYSPFIDLLLAALLAYFLLKKGWMKFLFILPLGYSILCFVIMMWPRLTGESVQWLPFFLRADYTIIGSLLVLLFLLSHKLSLYFSHKFYNPEITDEKELMKTDDYRVEMNFMAVVSILLVAILIYVLPYIVISDKHPFAVYEHIQTYMALAALPLLFYNGKRGYNAKWFQYGCYLYFPLHIILLFVIFYISFGY